MAGLTRLTEQSRQTLDRLNRQRPAAASQIEQPASQPPPLLFLGRCETPLAPADAALTKPDRRTRAGEVTILQQDYDADILDSQTWPIVAVAGATVDVTDTNEELSRHAVAGSQIVIEDSSGNDDVYELAADVSFDPASLESTLTFDRVLPSSTPDGDVRLYGRIELEDHPGPVVERATRHVQHGAASGETHVFARIGTEVIPLTASGFVEGYLLEPLDPLAIDAAGKLTPGCARMAVYDERDSIDADGNAVVLWERVSQIKVVNRSISVSGQHGQYCIAYRLGRSWRPLLDCGQTRSIEHDLEPEDLLDLTIWS